MANPAGTAQRKTAAGEALLLIKQVRKRGMHVPAKEVECATRGEPCGLASCHICREMLHHHAVDALFQRYDTSSGVQWATITPAYGRVELDDWREFDPRAFLNKVRRQLRNTMPPDTEVYGALDVSANSHMNQDHHLQFHVHAFIYPPLDKRIQAKVRDRCKRSRRSISKPVIFNWLPPEQVDPTARYTWKWFHKARSSMEAFDSDDGKIVYPKAKRPRMRRPLDRVVVHAILTDMRVRDLLFMIGIKPKNVTDRFQVDIMNAKRSSR